MKNRIIMVLYLIQLYLLRDVEPSILFIMFFMMVENFLLIIVLSYYEYQKDKLLASSILTVIGGFFISFMLYPFAFHLWAAVEGFSEREIQAMKIANPIPFSAIPLLINAVIMGFAMAYEVAILKHNNKFDFLKKELFIQLFSVMGILICAILAMAIFGLASLTFVAVLILSRIVLEFASVYRHRKLNLKKLRTE